MRSGSIYLLKLEVASTVNVERRKNPFDFVAQHRFSWLLVVMLVGILADQATKIWAQSTLAAQYSVTTDETEGKNDQKIVFYPIKVVTIIPSAVNFIYKENPAAAFSLTGSLPTWFRRPMLVTVSILATLFFLIWYLRMKANDGLLLASFSFILAGAVGNLCDRLRLGYVIDFIDVHAGFVGYPYLHWPTFNIADSFIVIGAIGVIFRTIAPYKRA